MLSITTKVLALVSTITQIYSQRKTIITATTSLLTTLKSASLVRAKAAWKRLTRSASDSE